MIESNTKPVETIEKEEYVLSENDKKFLRGAYGRNDTSRAGKLVFNALNPKKVSLFQKIKNFFVKLMK